MSGDARPGPEATSPADPRPERLTPDDVAAVLALAAAAAAHDGVEPLSEEFRLVLREPGRTQLVTRGADGAVVGAAIVSGEGVELVVHPHHRRRGFGRALLEAVRASSPRTRFWAHGDLPPARALARASGLAPVRELLKLGRAVTSEDQALPTAPGVLRLSDHPDGARDAALEAWLRLNALAFADHPEQGRWTRADVDERAAEPWFDPDLLLLLPDSGATDGAVGLAASLWLKPEDAERVEVYVVAVHPDHGGRGLGGALLRHALGEAARRGFRDVELYVDGGNTAARRLYERSGFVVRTRDVQYGA